MLNCKGVAAGTVLFFGTISSVLANPLLSEVYYDAPGADNGLEWVELYNPTGSSIDLANYSLGWAGSDYTAGTAQLSGSINPGDYFVIGGPDGGIGFDLVLNFSPDFQNAGSVPDAVGLFNLLAVDILLSSVPIDAVIYGPDNNSNGLLDETGAVGVPDVIDVAAGNSIERISLGGLWQIQADPTPGSGPFSLNTGHVPEPSVFWLMSVGLMGMLLTVRRRPS